MHSNQEIGKTTELKASYFLQKNGLRLVTTNYQCRRGEIDLIMQDQCTLVFVEVRSRSNTMHGGAIASIGALKRQRIVFAARCYLSRLRQTPACRFDVVVVQTGELQWIQAAFEC